MMRWFSCERPSGPESACMDEHDDDLSSEVVEGSEEEVDRFPNTSDELDAETSDAQDDEDENPPLDDDPAEL